jgi:PAS domain S-box-containing protein
LTDSVLARLASFAMRPRTTAADDSAALLQLVADAVQAGAVCLARRVDATWRIEQLCARTAVDMDLQVGAIVPWSALITTAMAEGGTQPLVVEDTRAAARVAGGPAASAGRVGALTAVPLALADGRLYGGLCALYPQARTLSPDEIPLLQLAGRLILDVVEAAARHEQECRRTQLLARYAAMVQASDDAIISTAADGRIEIWNPGAERLFGYTEAEAVGRVPRLLTAPDDRLGEAAGIARRVRDGEHIEHFETVCRRKDGGLLDVSFTASPIRDDGDTVIGSAVIARNISERKRAEEALAASEERFRGLFEHAPIGVVLDDAQGHIVAANAAVQRILGYTEDEFRRMTFLDVTHPDDAAADWTLFEELLAGTRDAYTLDKRFIHKDGHLVWGQIAVSVTRESSGAVQSIVGMLLDVTERHTAEERLQQSEAQYRHLVELAEEGIWQFDADHRTVYVNQKTAELAGYTPQEMLGKSLSAFLNEEGRALAAAHFKRTRDDQAADYEWHLKRSDGSAVWVHVTAHTYFDQHGRYTGGMAMLTDIRKRKQEEQALEEVRAAAEALAHLRQEQADEAQAMSTVSSALASTLEPRRLYQVILEQAARILHCDHTCVLLYEEGWATVAASQGVVALPAGLRVFPVAAIAPVMAYGADGQPALVTDTAAISWIDVPPLEGPRAIRSAILVPLVLDGTVVGTFNLDSFTPNFYTVQHLARARALGERVIQALRNARLFQLEQERARSAEAVARLKDDFVASVSHELRTPLTAIIGYSELLEARWALLDDARRRDQLHKIAVAARRQHRVVEDLLLLSSLERRAMPPAAVPVGVSDLLRQARDEIQGTYQGQDIAFDDQCAIQVLADRGRALRVVVNLLDNAAKYSPVGSPIIVSCSVEDGMGVVRVRDYGCGVPSDGRAVLFTRFGRVAGSRTRAGRVGTGLGLYLSRRLAEDMGGDLDLETSGPGGSSFRLRLPVVSAPAR